jgi:DNA integrity scanning protein DisA with diadenylate cyclase activity
MPFVPAAKKLRAQRQYPTMYWGGAAYFMRVDKALNTKGSSLLKTLRDYVTCCRRNSSELSTLTQQLDRTSGTLIFSRELAVLKVQPGFPKYE